MTDTFESPEWLAISLHCPLTAHSGHLANVDNGQGIFTQSFSHPAACTDKLIKLKKEHKMIGFYRDQHGSSERTTVEQG